jgi:hypothetical protein
VVELIHYGSQQDDPWVRRLVEILETVAVHVTFDDSESLDEWFEENEIKIKDLEWEIDDKAQDIDNAAHEYEKLMTEFKAAEFDSSKKYVGSFYEDQIKLLKARIVTLTEDLDTELSRYQTLRSNFDSLNDVHKELKDKYNTWNIIAS